jgi:uncharacterized phage-associated protein
MARAYEVARYLVRLAADEEEPDFLTHLRLQKLLYYVQAWSLAQRGTPLFSEQIQAWANGPVVREVYSRFRDIGRRPILPEDMEPDREIDLDEEDRAFVAAVWESYKGFSAWSLREMTHEEAPWLDARRGLGPADRCENEITHDAMREYFTTAG